RGAGVSCARYRAQLSRYLDGELTARQRSELLAHVGTCADCAAALARLRQSEVLLKKLPETRPSDEVRGAVVRAARRRRTRGGGAGGTAQADAARLARLSGLVALSGRAGQPGAGAGRAGGGLGRTGRGLWPRGAAGGGRTAGVRPAAHGDGQLPRRSGQPDLP